MHDAAIGTQALHGHAAQFLVGQVHGVACLEGNNLVPAPLFDLLANFYCGLEGAGEFGAEVAVVQYLDGAADQLVAQCSKGRNTGVPGIVRAKDLPRHCCYLLIADRLDRLNIHHRKHRVSLHVGVSERNATARCDAGFPGQVDHGNRPE